MERIIGLPDGTMLVFENKEVYYGTKDLVNSFKSFSVKFQKKIYRKFEIPKKEQIIFR